MGDSVWTGLHCHGNRPWIRMLLPSILVDSAAGVQADLSGFGFSR